MASLKQWFSRWISLSLPITRERAVGQMVGIICASVASGVYIWNSFDYWMHGISYWWVRFLVSAVLLLAAIVASRKLLQAIFAKSP
jgi:hypothetical protein